MTVFHTKAKPPQPELWIATNKLARPSKSAFYSKLDQTLDAFGFAGKVRELCAPAYDQSGMGRPGIDPVGLPQDDDGRLLSKTLPASGRSPLGAPIRSPSASSSTMN